MKRFVRRMLPSLLILLSLVLAAPAVASDLEGAIMQGMTEAMLDRGLRAGAARKISHEFLFMGTMLVRNTTKPFSVEEEELHLQQAVLAGKAMGDALSSAYLSYGDRKLQETASLMMRSVRAGASPQLVAATFSALAEKGYAYDAAVSILHETAEVVRSLQLSDGGLVVYERIRENALAEASIGSLSNEVRAAVREIQAERERLLAKSEAERRLREMRGGNEDGRARGGSSAGAGSGGSASAAGGNDNSSAGDSGNDAGGASGGNDSGGDASGGGSGGNDAGGASGGNDSGGGTSGGDSGGNDSGGASGGNDSGGGTSDGGSGGNDSGDGASDGGGNKQ